MLQKLSDHIAQCLCRAAVAERIAADATDPAVKSDYEQVARGWRNLAASYQFVESLERFLVEPLKTSRPD